MTTRTVNANLRDDEVIRHMVEGGEAFCQQHGGKWLDPDYCPEVTGASRQRFIADWQAKRFRCHELGEFLAATLARAQR
jgi:hypothetical protein